MGWGEGGTWGRGSKGAGGERSLGMELVATDEFKKLKHDVW